MTRNDSITLSWKSQILQKMVTFDHLLCTLPREHQKHWRHHRRHLPIPTDCQVSPRSSAVDRTTKRHIWIANIWCTELRFTVHLHNFLRQNEHLFYCRNFSPLARICTQISYEWITNLEGKRSVNSRLHPKDQHLEIIHRVFTCFSRTRDTLSTSLGVFILSESPSQQYKSLRKCRPPAQYIKIIISQEKEKMSPRIYLYTLQNFAGRDFFQSFCQCRF